MVRESGGKSHDELSEGLWDLVQRVRDTGKKGTIQFTVSVSTMKGDTDVLVISDEIKLRLPEHDRKASLFYTDKTGNLTRSDPQQLAFESLREVPAEAEAASRNLPRTIRLSTVFTPGGEDAPISAKHCEFSHLQLNVADLRKFHEFHKITPFWSNGCILSPAGENPKRKGWFLGAPFAAKVSISTQNAYFNGNHGIS